MARADMAVINGELKGFEIKSGRDSLGRLPSQTHLYGKVFDTMTIVLGPRHLKKVEASSPGWWGIVVAEGSEGISLEWQIIRPELRNPGQDPLSIAQLLWRDEVLEVLRGWDLARGLSGRPRKYLWEALASNFSLYDLGAIVRTRLKLRRNWRAAAAQTQCDEKYRPFSRSLGSLSRPNVLHTC